MCRPRFADAGQADEGTGRKNQEDQATICEGPERAAFEAQQKTQEQRTPETEEDGKGDGGVPSRQKKCLKECGRVLRHPFGSGVCILVYFIISVCILEVTFWTYAFASSSLYVSLELIQES